MKEDKAAGEALVKRLRLLRGRPGRERTGTFYIEGTRTLAQAVQNGAAIETCVVAPDLLGGDYGRELVATLRAAGVPIVELSPTLFRAISFKENLQGVGAVVRGRLEPLAAIRPGAGPGWVALDAVGNPGNLGAVLRTCDAVGCAGIILLGETIDPYHPAALRASTGAIFSQRLVRATFSEFAAWRREHGHTVVGTTGGAEREYRDVAYPFPVVLLMGSERLGLSAEQQAACDLLVRIPMVGTSDSLNLAVATSVVLYELYHQYRDRR
jgi:TrmH family RNA methyltransferase